MKVYPLEFVAELFNCSLSSLVKDCRAGRVDHFHRGDRRGMTIAHMEKFAKVHTLAATMSDVDVAIAMTRRAAERQTPRRRAA